MGEWRLNRRSLLISLAAIGIIPRSATAAAPDIASPQLEATLGAFANTIVPSDETPGAGDLGVHLAILNGARERTNYPQLLTQGAAWLDERAAARAGTGFAAAPEAVREKVVAEAFAASPGTLPRVFAEFLRRDIMQLYYGRPESWAGMISEPPQPAGYPLAHLPPQDTR